MIHVIWYSQSSNDSCDLILSITNQIILLSYSMYMLAFFSSYSAFSYFFLWRIILCACTCQARVICIPPVFSLVILLLVTFFLWRIILCAYTCQGRVICIPLVFSLVILLLLTFFLWRIILCACSCQGRVICIIDINLQVSEINFLSSFCRLHDITEFLEI